MKLNYKECNRQVIVQASEEKKLRNNNKKLQEKYKSRGLYKEYKNRPEEDIAQNILCKMLAEGLPDWNISASFEQVSRFDIELKHKTKPIVLVIEVKTKIETPAMYIWKFNNSENIDRLAGIPESKIGQVLEADYTVYFMTSEFGISSKHLASSTYPVGVIRKGSVKTEDYTYVPKNSKVTSHFILELDKERSFLAFREMGGITKLIKEIKEKYESPE